MDFQEVPVVNRKAKGLFVYSSIMIPFATCQSKPALESKHHPGDILWEDKLQEHTQKGRETDGSGCEVSRCETSGLNC